MSRLYFTIFLLTISFTSAICQEKWVPLIHELQETNPNSKRYGALLVEICWQISELTPDTSFYYGRLALDYAAKNNSDTIYARAYISLSAAESYLGNHAKAVELSFKGLDYAKKIEDTLSTIDALNNIGIDLYYQENYDGSINYYKQIIPLAKAKNDYVRVGNALNNIALIAEEKLQYDSAIYYYKKALENLRKIDDKTWLANTYVNLGNVYGNKSLFDLSTQSLDRAIALFLETKDYIGLSDAYNKVAYSLTNQGKLDAAERNVVMAISIADSLNQNLRLLESYKNAYQIYANKRNYQQAFKYLDRYQSLYQKMREVEQVEIIEELKEAYESAQKEKEIERLEKENTISRLNNEQAKQQQLILFLFIGLLIAITIAILLILKTKNTANKRLNLANEKLTTLNQTKDRLFSIISHDLKSPLSSFHLITLSLTDNWDALQKEQLKEYIITLRDSSANVRDMMDNLLKWALAQTDQLKYNPHELAPLGIVKKVRDQLSNALQLKEINFKAEIDDQITIIADKDYLEIIIRNLLANAIKFSKLSSEIIIKTSEAHDKKIISISDYGVGMNPDDVIKFFAGNLTAHDIKNSSEKGTGLGLNLCNELMKKMGGSIEVDSEVNKGTTFTLIFPKKAA